MEYHGKFTLHMQPFYLHRKHTDNIVELLPFQIVAIAIVIMRCIEKGRGPMVNDVKGKRDAS